MNFSNGPILLPYAKHFHSIVCRNILTKLGVQILFLIKNVSIGPSTLSLFIRITGFCGASKLVRNLFKTRFLIDQSFFAFETDRRKKIIQKFV